MTDRIQSLTVTLTRDIREDDVQSIVDAITMIKCVAGVYTNVVTGEDHFARDRVATAVRIKLHEAINDVFKDLNLERPSLHVRKGG